MIDKRRGGTAGDPVDDPNPADLTRKSFKALKWNYAGTIARVLAQLIFGIVLARLLGPEPFGLFAVMIITTGIAAVTVDLGLGAALVQKKELSEPEVRSAFSWVLMSGVITAVLVAAFSRPLATLMNDPDLVPVLIGAAIFIVIQAFGTVSVSLLKRRLDMKQLQVANITSYMLGFAVVGMAGALLGFGAVSLVAAMLTQGIVYSAIVYRGTRHSLRPSFRVDTSALRHFGARIVPINISNWIIENLDNVLVGRFFGMHALGLYSVSYNTVRTPTNHIVVTLQSVLFSAGSRIQDEDHRLQRVYLSSTAAVALVVFPVFAGVASVADTVVLALFGDHWRQAASLFVPLALAMLPHTVSALSGPVLWSKREVGRDLRIEAGVAALLLLSLLATSQISVTAMAWAVLGAYGLRAVLLAIAVLKVLNLRLSALGGAIRGSMLVAILCAASIHLADRMFAGFGIGAAYRLVGDVTVGGCVYLLAVVVGRRWVVSGDLELLLQRLSEHGPPVLQTWLRRWLLQPTKT